MAAPQEPLHVWPHECELVSPHLQLSMDTCGSVATACLYAISQYAPKRKVAVRKRLRKRPLSGCH